MINTYINNRGDYTVKNVAQFPSVQAFIQYVQDPSDDSFASTDIKKQSNIDKIYAQYYSDIDRAVFDAILAADPTSSIEKDRVGEYTKNLLIPLYKKGDPTLAQVSTHAEEISSVIDAFEEHKKLFNSNTLKLSNYKSFREFEDIANSGAPSEFLTYLKEESPYIRNGDIRYLGSTFLYDVFESVTELGNSIVSGAERRFGGPGLNGSRSRNYGENAFGH